MCTDEEPGYTCSCAEGYTLNGDETTCIDIDECALDSELCSPGFCNNVDGGYVCECPSPFEAAGGACVVCPAEGALAMTLAGPRECTPLGADEQPALLARAARNARWVLTDAFEAQQFLQLSSIYGSLADRGFFDGADGKTPFERLPDLIDFVEELEREVLVAENILSADSCSITLGVPSEYLCPEEEPLPPVCENDEDCGGGHFCATGQCEPMACLTDSNCNEGFVCGDTDLCERACPFDTVPVRLLLWPVGLQDVYARVMVGEGAETVTAMEWRLFEHQLAAIADSELTAQACSLVAAAPGGGTWSCPDPENTSGIVELDLFEGLPGEMAFEVNLRSQIADGSGAGLSLDWTFEDLFDSYVNEVPLPLSLDVPPVCPALSVRANDAENILSVDVQSRAFDALIPFALLNRGEVEECFDEAGVSVACPCRDDDGLPIDCSTSQPVECPYDSKAEPIACLPNRGSLKVGMDGLHLGTSLSVADEHEETIRIEELDFGDGSVSIERDGTPVGSFDSVVAVELSAAPPSSEARAVVRVVEEPSFGLLLDLLGELEVEATLNLDNISDRLVDLPYTFNDDVVQITLWGTDPAMRISMVPTPVRPVELFSGDLTLHSSQFEATVGSPGTLTVASGECLLATTQDLGADPHAFERFEGRPCPDAYYVAADASVLEDSPTTNLGQEEEMTVGAGRVALIRFDLDQLPPTVSLARVELFRDEVVEPWAGGLDIYGALDSWSESSVTWNTQPMLAASPAATLLQDDLEGRAGYRSVEITDLVAAWLDEPDSNHGLVITSSESGYLFLWSREYRSGLYAPRLIVEE